MKSSLTSTMTSCLFNNNNVTVNRMLRNTYIYENRMYTSKVKNRIIWGGKGKNSLMLIKSFINMRVGRGP